MSSSKSQIVLAKINLVVADVSATIAFYRLLGLDIKIDPAYPLEHVNVNMPNGFLLDIDSIGFAKKWDKGWNGQPGGQKNVLGFNVATRGRVDEVYDKLTGAGYAGQQPPYDAFWGARYAVVADPDENPVGIMSPISRDRKGPMPE